MLAISFLGWTVPSSIGVSGFGGASLFSLFTASIGEEMAKFPTGPALDDKFWCAPPGGAAGAGGVRRLAYSAAMRCCGALRGCARADARARRAPGCT